MEPSREIYECAVCKDQSIVIRLEDGTDIPIGDSRLWDDGKVRAHSYAECRCVEEKRMARLFKSSRITEQFQSVGFKGFVVKGRPVCVREALDSALHYYDSFTEIRATKQNSIALLGPPGSGKTHLLMAVSNGLMRQGVGVHYFPWVEGFGELKDNLDDLEPRLEIMRQVDVLFLDDLFKGRKAPTDFQLEQLFGVINYRYLECKPMLVSSERDIDEICSIDEGIGRRIWERARGHRVVMGLTDAERAKGMPLNYSLID